MFQTFDTTASPAQGIPRLAALRAQMQAQGLACWLVPRADAHQGEYVAPSDERLSWLTGFTGSAGFAAVLADQAGVFIDGRYRVQVHSQIADCYTPVHWPEVKLSAWLAERLRTGDVVGYDPWLHTAEEVDALDKVLGPRGITLRPGENLVDAIWPDRPDPPMAPFTAYPDDLAGETHAAKRARLAETLRAAGVAAAVITQPDSIAWLLNLRGTDVERNPVPQAFAILHADARVDLFARAGKADGVRDHLGADVTTHSDAAFLPALAALKGPSQTGPEKNGLAQTDPVQADPVQKDPVQTGPVQTGPVQSGPAQTVPVQTDKVQTGPVLTGPVQIDPRTCPVLLRGTLTDAGVAVVTGADPCLLPKAVKNATELQGTATAHLRDAAAMVQFLVWLDATAPGGGLTEIDVVRALEGFRRATNALQDISFDTIMGAGPHGAIVHYRVTAATNRAIAPGELLLIDSGGQYLDGTTDITRTVAVGPVPDDAPVCYTRVLQGMVAISRARFPQGVTGGHLDALARFPLWLAGQDYDHGTGHGVGVYLSVHEGPQRLSRTSDVALQAGMILSNEPGYYREGAFGIRIENLIVVEPAAPVPGGDARAMLGFRTLTWVPFDRRLIVEGMLAQGEREWIDAYHARVLDQIGPRVDAPALDWLRAACAPI